MESNQLDIKDDLQAYEYLREQGIFDDVKCKYCHEGINTMLFKIYKETHSVRGGW